MSERDQPPTTTASRPKRVRPAGKLKPTAAAVTPTPITSRGGDHDSAHMRSPNFRSPQNSPPANRTATGQFRQGVSGNPTGRPVGFVARIQSACGGRDYRKLVKAFALIAWGTAKQREAFFKESITVSTKDRLDALVQLRDSGPGRPMQTGESDQASNTPAFALPEGCTGVSVH